MENSVTCRQGKIYANHSHDVFPSAAGHRQCLFVVLVKVKEIITPELFDFWQAKIIQ